MSTNAQPICLDDLAIEVRKRLSWSEIGVLVVSVVALVVGFGGLLQAIGMNDDGPFPGVPDPLLLPFSLGVYLLGAWGVATSTTGGDRRKRLIRFGLVILFGVFLVVLGAIISALGNIAGRGDGGGGSTVKTDGNRERPPNLAAAVLDRNLVEEVLGHSVEPPQSSPPLFVRRGSLATVNAREGKGLLSILVYPEYRAPARLRRLLDGRDRFYDEQSGRDVQAAVARAGGWIFTLSAQNTQAKPEALGRLTDEVGRRLESIQSTS